MRQTELKGDLECKECGEIIRSKKQLLENSAVYKKLKEYRLARARSESVPAFVVFGNRTLRELTIHHPIEESALLEIFGIGPTKSDRYGEDILEILRGMARTQVILDEFCASCDGSLKDADAMEPLRDPSDGPKMANPAAQSVCPICERPWDGIRKGTKSRDTVESEERANIFTTELSKNGTNRVVVTIQAITLLDLGATFDDYISNPRIGRVFNSDDTGPFLWLPEWVSRPMSYLGVNNQGYWLVTFQHSYRRA